ncbi:protein of unknown function [Cupriavidus taiwanensis]|nr:protein of unknown function [Cupriavidus taiwanensis]
MPCFMMRYARRFPFDFQVAAQQVDSNSYLVKRNGYRLCRLKRHRLLRLRLRAMFHSSSVRLLESWLAGPLTRRRSSGQHERIDGWNWSNSLEPLFAPESTNGLDKSVQR